MGHGNHWRCIFPDLENGIADALGWVSRGTVIGVREYPKLDFPAGDFGAMVTVIAWPKAGLRANFVAVGDKRSGGRACTPLSRPQPRTAVGDEISGTLWLQGTLARR